MGPHRSPGRSAHGSAPGSARRWPRPSGSWWPLRSRSPRATRGTQTRSCLRAYFSEPARRFDRGFDPARSNSAENQELTPPAGLLLATTLHSEPAGCGALKFPGGAPAEIKRMRVAPAVRGLGPGRRILTDLEAHAAASQAPHPPAGNQPPWTRRSASTGRPATARQPRSTTNPTPTTGSKRPRDRSSPPAPNPPGLSALKARASARASSALADRANTKGICRPGPPGSAGRRWQTRQNGSSVRMGVGPRGPRTQRAERRVCALPEQGLYYGS